MCYFSAISDDIIMFCTNKSIFTIDNDNDNE